MKFRKWTVLASNLLLAGSTRDDYQLQDEGGGGKEKARSRPEVDEGEVRYAFQVGCKSGATENVHDEAGESQQQRSGQPGRRHADGNEKRRPRQSHNRDGGEHHRHHVVTAITSHYQAKFQARVGT